MPSLPTCASTSVSLRLCSALRFSRELPISSMVAVWFRTAVCRSRAISGFMLFWMELSNCRRQRGWDGMAQPRSSPRAQPQCCLLGTLMWERCSAARNIPGALELIGRMGRVACGCSAVGEPRAPLPTVLIQHPHTALLPRVWAGRTAPAVAGTAAHAAQKQQDDTMGTAQDSIPGVWREHCCGWHWSGCKVGVWHSGKAELNGVGGIYSHGDAHSPQMGLFSRWDLAQVCVFTDLLLNWDY